MKNFEIEYSLEMLKEYVSAQIGADGVSYRGTPPSHELVESMWRMILAMEEEIVKLEKLQS
jgi:hypothetical protein